MKVYGKRKDGTLLLSLGAGVGVLLRGDHASKPMDLGVLTRMGPFEPFVQSLDDRRATDKALARSRTISLAQFHLGGMSFDERRDRVMNALCSRLGIPMNNYGGMPGVSVYIPQNGLGEDWVVYCMSSKHYGVGYTIDEGSGTVAFDGQAQEVAQTWETLDERADGDVGIELKDSPFYKNFMKSKKKKLMDDMPGSLPNVNKAIGTY